MLPNSLHLRTALRTVVTPFVLVALVTDASSLYGQSGAVLIRLDDQQRPVVEKLDLNSELDAAKRTGLLVWSRDGEQERWSWLDASSEWPPAEETGEVGVALSLGTRGGGSTSSGNEQGAINATIQLAQLSGAILLRGSLFLSPVHQGVVLSGRPTLRRMPLAPTGDRYPAKVAVLYDKSNQELLRIAFAENQAAVRWSEIQDLPPALRPGLPAGRYTLRFEGGLEGTQFSVAADAERNAVLRPIQEMDRLLNGATSRLAVQFHVEQLLNSRDSRGNPRYLADALDLLEAQDARQTTPYLNALREPVRQWLENLARDPGYQRGRVAGLPLDAPTNIAAIDEVRELIAAGRWSEASARLGQIEAPSEASEARRVTGLRSLYEAVVGAEAGIGKQDETDAAFAAALEQLQDGSSADRLRAHVNYGNYRLRQVQDRLHNHAFQIAAGVRLPFLSALDAWSEAREHFELALALTTSERGSDRASLHLSLARCHGLLADILETLDVPVDGRRRFQAGQQGAVAAARFHARQANQPEAPDLVRGAAAELLAQLAFREGDHDGCRKQAESARELFETAGFLSGLEGLYRLLGLNASADKKLDEAIRHFQVSQLLAELLRDRFPADQLGVSRAGFFARRSYVYQQLVELHLATERPVEALRYAELAKARSAQDLLAVDGLKNAEEDASVKRELTSLLQAWPKNIAAVEYYLGERDAWVFVISPRGDVSAHPIRDREGRPVPSRELVTRIREFLSRTENQASRMAQALLSGRGFDNSWQHDLHRFYGELLPGEVRREIAGAEQVVVVPHHILHYFPFAALVVEPDLAVRKKTESVSPRYLVDEPYHLLYAPSLTVWDLLRQRPVRPLNRAQAMGIVEVPGSPPLPGVGQDLQNFQAVFGAAVKKVVEGKDATADQAKRLLGDPGVLLLATHGYNEPDRPLDSFLLFLPAVEGAAGASPSMAEGRLTARDIFATRVRASLVVMSACFSGLGDRSPLPGDDLFGLQRAFLQAGARTVVSGLWDVYDGTAPELIHAFFRHVQQGAPASRALALSQREFLAKLRKSNKPDVYLHPYFWAVYTVAGEDTANAKR